MRRDDRPMREVAKASWESITRISRGVVAGTKIRWTLKLSCGHEVFRYAMRLGNEPVHAKCDRC